MSIIVQPSCEILLHSMASSSLHTEWSLCPLLTVGGGLETNWREWFEPSVSSHILLKIELSNYGSRNENRMPRPSNFSKAVESSTINHQVHFSAWE